MRTEPENEWTWFLRFIACCYVALGLLAVLAVIAIWEVVKAVSGK